MQRVLPLALILVIHLFGQTGGADIAPRNVAQDSTPYSVHYSFIGLVPDTVYYVKIRIKGPGSAYYGYTYNPQSGNWLSQIAPWTDHPRVRTNSTGALSGWVTGMVGGDTTSAIDDTLQIVLRLSGTSVNIYPTVKPLVNILDMRTQGGWLAGHIYQDSLCTTPYQNILVIARDNSGFCVGSYVTENNSIAEGYDSLDFGYFKLAGIGTVTQIELRNQANSVIRGFTRTLGPWVIEPGRIKSIDSLGPDSIPPYVVRFYPDTTGLAIFNTSVKVWFSKPMDSSTINDTTFLVRGTQSQNHTGLIFYNLLDFSATFTSTRNFAFGETVYVTLKEWIRDTSGLRLDGDHNGTQGPDFRTRFKVRRLEPISEVHRDLDSNFIPDRLGDTILVTGVVTCPDSLLGDKFYLQDRSAGVCVYYGTNRLDVELGDSIFIVGTVDQYNGETELSQLSDLIVVEHNHQIPLPVRLNCRTFNHEDYEGRLIQISGVRTDSLILKGNRNYYLYDTSGVCIMRVHINTEIPGNIACADTFSIIGIKGQYDYSSRPDSFYEIFPRSAADFSRLTEVLNLSINEVQTPDSEGYDSKYKGCYVRIRGVVTGPDTIFGPGSLTSFFIQDSTGGINIYGADGDALAEKMADTLGAGFEIVGVVSEYNGLTEITRGWMRYLGPGMMPSPTFIPYNQFVQEIIEGRLVEVIGTVFEEPNISGSGRNFVVKNGYPAITVRVNNTVYTSLENVKAGKVLRIRGIAGQYDSEPPFDIGYQISIRFADDIAETSSTGFSREPVIESIEPNPFAPEIGEVARIRISSPPNFRLTLDLYNLNGKKVRSLLNEGQAGRQEVLWDGRDEARGRCPTGIYLVNLKAVSPEGKTYYRRRLIVLGTRF